MSQQQNQPTNPTSHSNEVELFDQEQFGNLIKLPDILLQNRRLADKAVAALPINSESDLTAMEIGDIDQYEATLTDYSVKLKTSYELNMARRKPFTGFFDNIREKFTAEEKRIIDAGDKTKQELVRIAKEKKRRIDEEEEKKLKAIQEENERIEKERLQRLKAVDDHATMMDQKQRKMNEMFYADIDKFEKVSVADVIEVDFGYDDLNASYVAYLSDVKKQLRDRIPSRRIELAEIEKGNQAAAAAAAEREKAEKEAQAKAIEEQKQNQVQRDNTVAASEKLNAAFDVHAQAGPNISQAKGVKFKKKYEPKNSGGYVALLQWWVQNIMPTLNMEELGKKLSFIMVPANDALNKGDAIESAGLAIVDDVKTRISKS